jgi:hypothetical protein
MIQGSKQVAKLFHWQNNAQPIVSFLKNPYHLPAFEKITMPNLIERAGAVARRGGRRLIIKRTVELINDILK